MRKLFLAIVVSAISPLWASGLVATPQTFDFGWSPRNAKITAQFIVVNQSPDLIPLNSVEAACGCTASNFSSEKLSSQDETKVELTFNTRGYDGIPFDKPAKLKTDSEVTDISVTLKGHVMDFNAKLFPTGDGVAEFIPGDKNKKTIRIQNSSNQKMILKYVQGAADWAKVTLSSDEIKPLGDVDMTVEVQSIPKNQRVTSVTVEGIAETEVHRFTVAIRSGEEPKQQRIKAPIPKSK